MRYFVFVIIVLIALTACQPSNQIQASLCKQPYFEWQQGMCCLDQNGNKICDEHERIEQYTPLPDTIVKTETPVEVKAPVEEVKPTQEKTIMQELIDKAPTAYYYYNFDDDAGGLVVGDRRSDGYVDNYLSGIWAPMSWNVNEKRILLTAPWYQMDEMWYNCIRGLPKPQTGSLSSIRRFPTYFEINLTGNPDVDLGRIPDQIRKYYWTEGMDKKVRSDKYFGNRLPLIFFQSFYSKGPVDVMKEYAKEIPIKIDETSTIITAAGKQYTTNLSIHYRKKEDPSKTLVFRIDPKLNVLILLEELNEKGERVKRTEFDVLKTVTYQGKKNVPIEEKHVQPLPNYVIITPEEFDAYHEAAEGSSRSDYLERRCSWY